MRHISIALLIVFSPLFAQSAKSISPDAFMQQSTVRVLGDVDSIEPQDREDLLSIIRAEIMPHVDSTFMAKWVAGRQAWTLATKEQQDEFVESFMSLLAASYANTLVILKDKHLEFKVANKNSRSGNRAQVLCIVGEPDQDPIHVIFQMKVIDDKWMVFDVILEGISLLKGLEVQFSDDINTLGLSVVTERIKRHHYKVRGPLE